ncbi:adenosine nucleotide hydrolase [Spongiactinospora gelatinilytica]|uniref:Adenosine nucleotide hydrolase n=1 Tax=Spongiactinospora gelatinilytica TaxID=2666298 RepID=A0A2W2EX48_9ACTN|nr:diphthine--ammonia ligase [Spongiactinospora gelatinilytica]PZG29186.1 adenosine nucleotide hydrolase [Spongiactinospora gelatinilytica]
MEPELAGSPFFCSWSGGKDSALAFHRAVRHGGVPGVMVTMMTETGLRSRSHGLRREVLARQAAAIGVPIRFVATTWDDYENKFCAEVRSVVAGGIGRGVFGDIDTESHREWELSVCARAGATAHLPLWQTERPTLMRELLDNGFQAAVVAVRDGLLPPEILGKVIDAEMLGLFTDAGVDIAGENGEYHTVVTDGPIFRTPLRLTFGETILRDGVWFIDAEADAG